MRWAKKAGVEPMMAVNLGTRGVQEAIDLLDYSNGAGGSFHSDLRDENGTAEAATASRCGASATRWTARGRSATRPRRSTAASPPRRPGRCASSTPTSPSSPAARPAPRCRRSATWEREVLEETYDEVDLISMHAYYWEKDGDLASFLASGVEMDDFIDDVVASVDHVRAAQNATASASTSRSTSGTSGTSTARPVEEPPDRLARRARAARGPLQRRRRRRRRAAF